MVEKIENAVSNPARFCGILNLKPMRCAAILRENHNVWEQINVIARAWFDSQTDPMWETIVKALIRIEKQGAAERLAKETGVDYQKAEAEEH